MRMESAFLPRVPFALPPSYPIGVLTTPAVPSTIIGEMGDKAIGHIPRAKTPVVRLYATMEAGVTRLGPVAAKIVAKTLKISSS